MSLGENQINTAIKELLMAHYFTLDWYLSKPSAGSFLSAVDRNTEIYVLRVRDFGKQSRKQDYLHQTPSLRAQRAHVEEAIEYLIPKKQFLPKHKTEAV